MYMNTVRNALLLLLLATALSLHAQQQHAFHVLAFYSETVEQDHIDFAHQAIDFFNAAAKRDHYDFATTKDWNDMNPGKLAQYQLVVWLDDFPHTPAQRTAFEQYMEHGGGWLGFHIAAYNDAGTRWPWFLSFLGGGVFYGNNWPPLPATLIVDDKDHPVTRGLGNTLQSPANEWYIWKPSPRLNPDIKVLMSLAPSNYPIGFKDIITGGDLPVVWTNTRYRMLYMNMGHGDRVLSSEAQNKMIENAMLWVAKTHNPKPSPGE
ncbi:Trehalose utilisation [Granulicella pectinivorans]|uniref:Trehalose utilisation n=2 Tax=Granulicella pectinivorans TaxID=474950 RepID=A0A1I6LUU8_9BACT|nr:Trehalose utilisation [Granulicella pectinivorans]